MKKIEVWEVMANSDTNEGRGPMRSTGIAFTTKESAVEFIKSIEYRKTYGVQGTEGHLSDIKQRIIYKHIEDNSLWIACHLDLNREVEYEEKRIKEQALAKLTPRERAILKV